MPVVKWAAMCVKAEKIRSILVRDASYVPNAKLEGMVSRMDGFRNYRGDMG